MRALIFDTETTGMVNFREDPGHPSQPWPIEIAWEVIDLDTGESIRSADVLIELPPGIECDGEAFALHGITADEARRHGVSPTRVVEDFVGLLGETDVAVCHSWDFDRRVMTTLGFRCGFDLYEKLKRTPHFCTMVSSTALCKLAKPGGRSGFKWPTLEEAHEILVGAKFASPHRALSDVQATSRVLLALHDAGKVVPGIVRG